MLPNFASTSSVRGVPSGPETHLGAPVRWMPLCKRVEKSGGRSLAGTSLAVPR